MSQLPQIVAYRLEKIDERLTEISQEIKDLQKNINSLKLSVALVGTTAGTVASALFSQIKNLFGS